ncbi:polysaccharide deacetylase family protein [Xanthomonas campestris pv. campestris]|uniref:polysaccharide deacetylase family protein n=1 Tax=Xanthomonas campestris TaxID=339 RepID=UPI000839A4FF|nr:polysaccharide deacetylase family protein [Xanthomonas campestris]MCF8792935.1 polysaccharide deacetylase family protein [Xanthomonas campestris pv. campestris]MCF8869497.1 polysaccharide deacetylase family protein [Xanthomonas campestris pv. campestris]MCF8873890.1 polysaccharide deacetylase family protein [Xanthomonas campestris pv. campestris]MCF8874430.1 polysaccharide deacetylase family protein [Xanthomonas campestris pv. campestris]MEA0656392.1 polysaccharide deacetylase family protei
MSTARDLVGYGATPPPAQWPGGARIAVQFVINYEEGAENCVLNGDAGSEAFLSEMVGAPSHPGARAMAMESLYEYGSRAGFWRLHRLFSARGVPVTVFGVATALAANPEAVAAMQSADWEIASHGLRWIDYQHVDAATERARLVAEEGGFVYDADSYADDVPYYDRRHGRAQLIVPYTLDVNDMKFVAYNGFDDGEPFFRYMHDSFEQLRSEGGRMLSIGLHGRIVGKPARAAALARFVDHVLASGDAWVARRIDIARHWLQVHPA